MRIPRNKYLHGQNDDKRSKNRETAMSQSMKKNRRPRGRNLLAGASAAAVAAGLSANVHAGDADRHRLELGLGVSRLNIDAPTETFEPFWAGDWDDVNYELPLSAPNRDLGVDLGRELWLRFRPRNSSWSFGFSARDGSASRSIDTYQTEPASDLPRIPIWIGPPDILGPASPDDPDFVSVRAERHEEFEVVDFEVGKDVGLGFLREGGESRVSFGFRYARFRSETTGAEIDGQPNRYDPESFASFYDFLGAIYFGGEMKMFNADTFDADFESRREFRGWGPAVSWTASQPLFGNDHAGHVLLDWTLGGGVLFGKQETEVDHDAASRYYSWPLFGESGDAPGEFNPPQEEELDAASHERVDPFAVVPFVNLDLGLSYKRKRTRVSVGYRFEEYVGAIDGGVDERKEYDRTFEGPYLRFSFGFFGGEEE